MLIETTAPGDEKPTYIPKENTSDIKVTREGVTIDGTPVKAVFDISINFNVRGPPHVIISRFKQNDNGQVLGDESGPLKISEEFTLGHLEISY